MADLFTLLASQVLGSQPEVGPLLPPRFAAWPDLPLASPLAQAPEPVDEPETAEAALFPPPLIAAGHPAVDTPLPSLRQLSQVRSGPGYSIQPDLASMPEDMPETAGAEPGDIQPDAAPPLVPDPTTAVPPAGVGQTSQPPPAQPAVQDAYNDATQAEPGEPGHIADRPVTPFVPEPALEPATAPEPAPVLQQAGPAQGAQAPSTSPLERASRSQPGDLSPDPAWPAENRLLSAEGRTADATLRPLLQSAPPGPAPLIQRQAGPVAGQGETSAPQASVGDQATAAPEGPLSEVGFSPGHDRPTIDRRADTAQGAQAPSTSPLERASHSQPGDSSPGQAGPAENPPLSAQGRTAAARDPAAAIQESRRADTPLRPLLQSAPPEPAPVLQRQVGTAAKAAAPPSPASTTPQTQPVANQGETSAPQASVGDLATASPERPLSEAGISPGHDRPTLQRGANTAKGDQSPSISPLKRASPYQPGDSSPAEAGPPENPLLSAEGRPAAAVQGSRRADTALRPLVQSAPLEPEPVIQRQVAPGADLPPAAVTLSAAPPSAMEELSAPPLRPGVTSAPGAQPQATSPTGESLTGAEAAIRPLDQPLMPQAVQPGPAAGRGTPAPAQAAFVDQRPPGRIGHEAPDDGRGLPGPAEPSIVPAPEALPAGGRSASRAGERVFSRREPAPGWTGMREPPPAVRVTIGRVEVRMAPPEPPPPVQPRQPHRLALSLDEYLKGGEP